MPNNTEFDVATACDEVSSLGMELQRAIGNSKSTGRVTPAQADQMQQWVAAIELRNSKIREKVIGKPPGAAGGSTGAAEAAEH